MIIKFKTFENNNQDSSQYIGKFFKKDVLMKEFAWEKESHHITLVTNIDFEHNTSRGSHRIAPRGETFTVYKSGEIGNPSAFGYDYNIDEFKNIIFMTPEEFYNDDKKFCIKLYLKILADYNEWKNSSGWYKKTVEVYKKALETIPDLKIYADSEKYNL